MSSPRMALSSVITFSHLNNSLDKRRAFRDERCRLLEARLAQSRRAMLWAIHERRADKAAHHAALAAHYGRLLMQRRKKLGG